MFKNKKNNRYFEVINNKLHNAIADLLSLRTPQV